MGSAIVCVLREFLNGLKKGKPAGEKQANPQCLGDPVFGCAEAWRVVWGRVREETLPFNDCWVVVVRVLR